MKKNLPLSNVNWSTGIGADRQKSADTAGAVCFYQYSLLGLSIGIIRIGLFLLVLIERSVVSIGTSRDA